MASGAREWSVHASAAGSVQTEPARAGTGAGPTTTPRLANIKGHIPALDGVRGLAILLVLLFHSTFLRPGSAVEDYFVRVMNMGWCGVDLFFVLSGFLITGILYDSKQSGSYFRSFYGRRLVRIFPLYYAVLLVAFYVIPQAFGVNDAVRAHQAWYWLYASNMMHAATDSGSSPHLFITWSLAVEEQFYLLWPAVVLMLDRRHLVAVCAALIPAVLVTRIVLLSVGVHSVLVYTLTFCRFDTMAVGALVALLIRGPGGVRQLVQPARWIAAACCVALLVVFAASGRQLNADAPAVQTAGYTALALLFGSVIVLALAAKRQGRAGRFWSHPFLRMLGKYSYAMYLFHVPIQLAISAHLWGPKQLEKMGAAAILGQLLGYALLLGATLIAAMISWRLFESQFLKLKKYFPYRPPQTASPPAEPLLATEEDPNAARA